MKAKKLGREFAANLSYFWVTPLSAALSAVLFAISQTANIVFDEHFKNNS